MTLRSKPEERREIDSWPPREGDPELKEVMHYPGLQAAGCSQTPVEFIAFACIGHKGSQRWQLADSRMCIHCARALGPLCLLELQEDEDLGSPRVLDMVGLWPSWQSDICPWLVCSGEPALPVQTVLLGSPSCVASSAVLRVSRNWRYQVSTTLSHQPFDRSSSRSITDGC